MCTEKKKTDEKIIWIRNDYKQFTCCGRVHTRHNHMIIKYVELNHVPYVTQLKCRGYMNDLKEVAKTSQLSTHIVNNMNNNIKSK
jgi:hypothetical protein